MAQQTIVELIDDLDGSEADETVAFALDGKDYEIDLNAENAERLRGIFVEWSPSARKIGGRPGVRGRTPAQRSSSEPKEDPNTIRQWATDNGHQVSARGRISSAIRDAYHAAVG